MKKFILFLLATSITLCVSCFTGENCTSEYLCCIKIDGNKNDKVSIKYIGPKKREYEKDFNFKSEPQLPYFDEFFAHTICKTKDFKKHGYNFLEIKNLGANSINITLFLIGKEIEDVPNWQFYTDLLGIYHEQDIDPNFDYTKEPRFQYIKNYIPRQELYKKLEDEKYPYFIKLPPKKTCIVKWGNKGIQIL